MKRLILVSVFGLSSCMVPGYRYVEWHAPTSNTGYGTWSHDITVNNGCNEWNREPVAEVDNNGVLCKTYVP